MPIIELIEMDPQDQELIRGLAREINAATSDNAREAKEREAISAWLEINARYATQENN